MIDRLQYSMQALQMFMRAQEVTANNLANINTPGFKGDQLFYRAFQDELGNRSGSGIQTLQTLRMQQGSLESTGNPFDFAIEGEGFFQIQNESGSFLSRDGRFELNGEGFLVDQNGGRVQGEGGVIHLPQFVNSGSGSQDINIDVEKDGTIKVEGRVVDKLQLVTIDDVSSLERRTNAYLAVRGEDQIKIDQNSQVAQGFYETGNVNPLQELLDMTRNLRMFETQQRAMRTTDEMLSQATRQLGRF